MRKLFSAFILTSMVLVSFLQLSGAYAQEPSPKVMIGGGQINLDSCHQMMMHHLGPADKEFDLRFINMMIQHHQQAIVMSKEWLSKAQHVELKQLMQNIIEDQQKEIDQMVAWRKAWYGK